MPTTLDGRDRAWCPGNARQTVPSATLAQLAELTSTAVATHASSRTPKLFKPYRVPFKCITTNINVSLNVPNDSHNDPIYYMALATAYGFTLYGALAFKRPQTDRAATKGLQNLLKLSKY